jgi:hypothetical protein
MEDLAIMGTPKTPAVRSDSIQGLLEITGRSNPENTIEVFKPIVNWVEMYVQNPGEKTTVNIQLEYFNTSSSKFASVISNAPAAFFLFFFPKIMIFILKYVHLFILHNINSFGFKKVQPGFLGTVMK